MKTKTKVTLVSLFLSLILLAAPVLAGADVIIINLGTNDVGAALLRTLNRLLFS